MDQTLISSEPPECMWEDHIPVQCQGMVNDCNCTLNLIVSGEVQDPDQPGIFWNCTGLKTPLTLTFFTQF